MPAATRITSLSTYCPSSVGILSPLVLLPERLFAGPYGAPTLEGQYVLKDVILVAAGMVIAAVTFRGGRLVRGDLPPSSAIRADVPLDGEQKLRLILEGAGDPLLFAELSDLSDTGSPKPSCMTGARSRARRPRALSPSMTRGPRRL